MNVKSKPKQPLKVFCSYSHKDEKYLAELHSHLSSLSRANLIEDWSDQKINPGSDWEAQINQNLESADLILFLVSSDFINSDYCMQNEVVRGLQRHDAGEAIVIPIFLRQCVIKGLPFERLQGSPRDTKWINQQTFPDKGWAEVTEAVRLAANARLANQSISTVTTLDNDTILIDESNSLESIDVLRLKEEKKPKYWSYYLLVIPVLIFVAWMIWGWYEGKDSQTLTARSLLGQGEYEQARQHCERAPFTLFRIKCLEFTELSVDKIKNREAFLNEVEKEGSEYAQMRLGDFRVADFTGENSDTLLLAEEHYANALQMNANLSGVYFGRGLIRHLQVRLDDAISEYKQALKKAPENARFALNLATAYSDTKDFAKSETLLRRLLATHNEVLIGHVELIEVLLSQGKNSEAKSSAQELQAFILLHGKDVICKPINTGEWMRIGNGSPQFLPSWANEGSSSWDKKVVYINHFIKMTDTSVVNLPKVDCDVFGRSEGDTI